MTLPDLMQAVQAFTRRGAPFTMARTRWIFGLQRRFVRTWEWETDMPQDGPFPHTSHTAAIFGILFVRRRQVMPSERRGKNYQREQTDPNRQTKVA